MTPPKIPFWIFIVLVLLYACSIWVDTMDVDASQYARISSEMLHGGSYLQLYEGGKPYLDKPPFLFWISSLGMWLLGHNNAGFKVPSILFAVWALYATYRFARLLYSDWTARLAALILATSQAMFLMTNDIRTDTVLMSWVITTLWWWKEWEVQRKNYWLYAAFAAIAFGMMSKGPIALIAPAICMGIDWVLKGKWRNIFNVQYLPAILVTALLLLPMSIGLYEQYDLHPEVVVNEKTGVSGLRFFYWTQSFGRITGENVWNNGAPFSFLFENMLWAFIPWTLIFIVAYLHQWQLFFKACKNKMLQQYEWHTLLGFTMVYIMLGLSKYQLPHYLFVVYPLAAILTSSFIHDIIQEQKLKKWLAIFTRVQWTIGFIMILVTALIVFYVFPENRLLGGSIWVVCVLIFLYVSFRFKGNGRIIYGSVAAAILANIILTNFFYRTLLQYQAGNKIGTYIQQNTKPNTPVYELNYSKVSTYFYAQRPLKDFSKNESLIKNDWVVTDSAGIEFLKQNQYAITSLRAFPGYHVSIITTDFLNPAKRGALLDSFYVLKVQHL